MFRNVAACSGMFRVPGFIDGLEVLIVQRKKKIKTEKIAYLQVRSFSLCGV